MSEQECNDFILYCQFSWNLTCQCFTGTINFGCHYLSGKHDPSGLSIVLRYIQTTNSLFFFIEVYSIDNSQLSEVSSRAACSHWRRWRKIFEWREWHQIRMCWHSPVYLDLIISLKLLSAIGNIFVLAYIWREASHIEICFGIKVKKAFKI